MNVRLFLTLVRREIQEHCSLWIVPVCAAFGPLGATLFAGVKLSGRGMSVTQENVDWVGSVMKTMPVSEYAARGLIGTVMFVGVIAAVAVVNYLLDCLYAERRDRSILFWKSLPVSDAATVSSKLFVALVLVPLFVLLLATLLQPVLLLILYLRYESVQAIADWSIASGSLVALGRLLLMWIYAMLWYLPVAAYCMLASVLARRTPWVYALVPVILVSLWDMLRRTLPFLSHNEDGHPSIFQKLVFERLMAGDNQAVANLLRADGDHMLPFQSPSLWVGIVVAAVALWGVVRLRRYRDDT